MKSWVPRTRIAAVARGPARSGSHFWLNGAMQARAAEMMVWVNMGRRRGMIERILADHPHTQVRLTTIDAEANSLRDDPAALDSLRA